MSCTDPVRQLYKPNRESHIGLGEHLLVLRVTCRNFQVSYLFIENILSRLYEHYLDRAMFQILLTLVDLLILQQT